MGNKMKFYIYVTDASKLLTNKDPYSVSSGLGIFTSNQNLPDTWVFLQELNIDLDSINDQLFQVATGQLEVEKERLVEEFQTKLTAIENNLSKLKALTHKGNTND
jgi:hypothetical protein